MSTEKLKGVYLKPEVKLPNTGGKKTKELSAQSKDVVSISRETKTDKTNDLVEAAKILKFEKDLKELIPGMKNVLDPFEPEVVGPVKLKKGSNSEILDKVNTHDSPILIQKDMHVISEGDLAIWDFKKLTLGGSAQLINDDSQKTSLLLDKIEQLFQSGGFSKIVCVYQSTDLMSAEYTQAQYLIGITEDNYMIALSIGINYC